MRSRPRIHLRILIPLALCLLCSAGCGTRYERITLEKNENRKVLLRAELEGGQPVLRDFNHPASISGVRCAHILAGIDVRLSSSEEQRGDRRPAIPTDLVYELGNLLSAALAKATPNQEIVIEAIRKARHLGIFTQKYVTSFVAWVEGEELIIHLSRVDQLIAKGEEDDIREPYAGKEVMRFKVLPTEGIVPIAPQAVQVAWRDPRFRKARNIRIGPSGQIERRTILLEETEAPELEDEVMEVPTSPDALRELADLEEQRRSGAVSEGEYHRRRDALLRAASGSGP